MTLNESIEAQQRQAVIAEALTWLDTPYHHHGRLKGVGVDCGQSLCAIYEAAGVVAPIDPGIYSTAWHLHRSDELYIDWLQRAGAVRTDHPKAGDVALFRFGRTFSHGGVLVDRRTVLHAYVNQAVILTRLDEAPLAGRPVQFWTLWKSEEGAVQAPAQALDSQPMEA
ncbi:NlpC/P60 family protein [Rhizobacter sp. P5_C2]